MKKKGIKTLSIILAVILVLGIGGFSFLFFNGLSGLHIRTKAQEGQIKVACVGDSITYGHGVTPWHKNNYPAILQNLLGDDYNVQNFGVSGTTAHSTGDQPYSETDIYKQSIEYDADILVFMLGSNDSKPENWTNAETFKKEYLALLDTYITDENLPKIYLGIPAKAFYEDESQTVGITTYDIQPNLVDEIAEIIKGIAAERGYKYIDIYSLTAENPQWFEADFVHPNADGAKVIANEFFMHIKGTEFEIGNDDFENQIKLIVSEFYKWYVKYTDVYSGYCVTDLNQNGLLEIVSCYNQGTGLYSENTVFEVNEEINGLIECKYNEELEFESQPDLLFFNSVNCYSKDNNYFYVFEDCAKASAAEHFTAICSVYLKNKQLNSNLIAFEEMLLSENEDITMIYQNSKGEKITENEFKNAEKEYFNGYKSESVKFGWYKGSPDDNALLLNKTNEELISLLIESFKTFNSN